MERSGFWTSTSLLMQYFTTALLIATVLTCPYGCLAGANCAASGEAAAPSCCGKCCHEPAPARDHEPMPDDDAWDCCLCEGALVEAGTVELLRPLEAAESGLEIAAAVSPRGTSLAFSRLQHESIRVHGGDLRIALQSFLC